MGLLEFKKTPELAPEFLHEYLAALAQFGANETLTTWAEGYAEYHAGRCYWDARFIGSRCQGKCLNIGGAPYIFEFAIKKLFPHIDVTTIDLDPARFPNVESVIGIRVLQGDIESDTLPTQERFDFIVLTEVFEHLRINLLDTMSRIRDLLTEGGRLYLTMPNGLGYSAWRNHLLRGRTGPSPVVQWVKLKRLGHMGHVREYSLTEISEVLLHCGFTIDESHFRVRRVKPWPVRDLLLKFRSAFADEVLLLASRAQ